MIFAPAMRRFSPRPRVRSLDWFRANVSTHEGRPYDHNAYPHIGAPGGPCDAFDDPAVSTIWLQWASRLGKTFFGQAAQLFVADARPCPMMFASESQKLTTEVVQRTYGMIAKCRALCGLLPVHNRRSQSQISFVGRCRIYAAWARSVSTLADKPVRVGHANEVDKWEHRSTSKEADPLKLFQDRGKEFPSRKFILESTPAVKGSSRIERGRLASTNCHFYVPCPHCQRYQQLRMGDGSSPGGIRWTKLDNGKSDKEMARRTACYVCQHCEAEIRDDHRATMMRRGVWVPEGCGVDDAKAAEVVRRHAAVTGVAGGDGASADGKLEAYEWRGWKYAEWITGTPVRNGRDAGYQLSSLYALSLGWGDIAAEFVESKERVQNLRNFINQWLAETWEIVARKTTWQQLGDRLIDKDTPREIVPVWASLLTAGFDRQSAGGDRFPYCVDAWGPGRRNATIMYGELERGSDFRSLLFDRGFAHADGGESLKLSMALMDSGHKPEGVYELCRDLQRDGFPLYPCKGSGRSLDSDYWINTLGKDSSMPGMQLVHIDSIRTQAWMDRMLHVVQEGEEGRFTIHAGSLMDHQDFLEQLLNDAAVSDLDSRNNERENWERIDVNVPNDLRDCRRYSYGAMLIATRGAEIRPRSAPAQAHKAAVVSMGLDKTAKDRW